MTRIWVRRYDDDLHFKRDEPEQAKHGWWWTLEVDEEKIAEWEAVNELWIKAQNEMYELSENQREDEPN